MNILIKFLSKRNFIHLRKLILHFSLKISGYKNFGNFYDTGEEYSLKELKKNEIKNCLDIGAHIGNFSEKLLQINGINVIAFEPMNKTFKELNQLELVRQAGIRQQYIDQSVSLNLAFPSTATPKWINKVHFDAWKKGIKTLYYVRTESVLRGDIADQAMSEDCVACDG